MAQDDPLDGSRGVPADPEGFNPEARGLAADGPAADGRDWAPVRDDFLYSGMAQRRIAWKYGMTENTLRQRRRAEGWERVVPVQRLPTHPRPALRDGEPPTPTAKRRGRMVRRLFAVLDTKIAELEARMTGEDRAQSAADAERDARALTALARLYAKLVEMDEGGAAAGAGGRAGTGSQRTEKDGDDADRLRRDLADRLARLAFPGDP
jgi:hypothetical protein